MKKQVIISALSLILFLSSLCYAGPRKTRLFVVSSYHPEYLWSQDTNKGFCAALIDFKFFDNQAQADEYTRNDYIETERTIIKRAWMDTKRRSKAGEIADAAGSIIDEINEFKPDLIFLGDDNAANYIGSQFIDTDIPVVFWGINGFPMKYGLLDSIEWPGHNVTGVYQAGYVKECLEYLKKLIPGVTTFAVLADDSETGRTKAKELQKLASTGKLPLKLIGAVVTDSLEEWQSKALDLQKNVDAFFVLNHNTIRDKHGKSIDQLEIGAWYLKNIAKPECSQEKQFAQEGMLLVVDDSGFKQGYEAVKIADQILRAGKNPANIPVYAPERGQVIVNRERAKRLGIDLTGKDFVEEYIDKSLALEKYP
ncbi:MAG: ABC transporter substrate binding protein [Candidatus Omnitrophota bacterium]